MSNTVLEVISTANYWTSQAVNVYLNPELTVPSSLSPRHAGYALAHHMGLEFFEPIADNDEAYDGLLGEQPFVGKGISDGLLLTLNEVDAHEVLPPSLKSTFSISKSSPIFSISSLVNTYNIRAQHAYSSVHSISSSHRPPQRLLDIFSFSSPDTEEFLSELSALSDFFESDSVSPKFGAFQLTGLERIALAYGRSSQQYVTAAHATRAIFESALSTPSLHFALITFPPISSAKAPVKRQQSPLPPSLPPQPIGSISTCFETADVCGNTTSSCSGRGECVRASKAGRTCFVCACKATKSAKGKTETWAGESCERKDISAPFVLIAGTVIALIVLIGGSISLLSTIGGQELPSTLMSGAPAVKRD